ncbi:MAG: hypothetical protein KAY32_15635 [Candidatus Eisenbacteria sp.]|nr:hypothetical protein [Candidatus Eisenbacteria bacterium]
MPSETASFERGDFYWQISSEPMRRVAARYGISDVALAKICRKLKVPRPPRGYWARKAAGKPVTQDPLPPLPQRASAGYRIGRLVDPIDLSGVGDEARRLLLREHDPAMAVAVPDELRRPHPWIRKSTKALRTFGKRGKRIFDEQACLDVQALKPSASTSNTDIPRAGRSPDSGQGPAGSVS